MIKRGTRTISKIYRGAREIAKIYRGRNLVWENGEQPQPVTGDFLTFSSPNSFTLATANASKNWDGTLEYSQDAQNWSTWDGTTTLTAAANGGTYCLYVRGYGNTKITGYVSSGSTGWSLSGSNIACRGDIRTLLNYANVESTSMASYCFWRMFEHADLTSAPVLPSSVLSDNCYELMFSFCSSLSVAPSLPAMTLATSCYLRMFAACTSLTEAPALPAATMYDFCYSNMFVNCSSLTSAPALPATTLAGSCYAAMFSGCASLNEIPEISATAFKANSCNNMFSRCSSIKLSETQTDEYSTPYRVPSSGTGVTEYASLTRMFYNTGGTFTGTPTINTKYYTSNAVIPAT